MEKEKIEEIGNDEDQRWSSVYQSINKELSKTGANYDQDRKVARILTSELVAANEEDKIALASDEAVAHGLVRLRRCKSKDLDYLLEQPYFARVVTKEEDKEIEFRIGTASFPEQRIIDWRKGPISKLYYDYQEGEEFSEYIQGHYREGTIQLRRGFHGVENQLNSIEMPQGTIYRENGGWKFDPHSSGYSRTETHDGHLPPILSLITPEQFKLISSDSQKPMVIQGIAGSGKTTVALHRLAWLLHEENANLDPKKTVVIMFNRALKNYVETTLPELNIEGVPIMTYNQWTNQLLNNIIGPRPRGSFLKSRSLEMFKSSPTILEMMGKFVIAKERELERDYVAQFFQFFEYLIEQDLFWPKWDKIVESLKDQVAKKFCDFQDDSLLCHIIYSEHGRYPIKGKKTLGLLEHIVIDEAQDFGMVEIRSMLNALDLNKTVTIVGDIAQRIVMGRDFSSWDAILNEAGFESTRPITLNVSHRTTEEIMKLASHVRLDFTKTKPIKSSGKHGPSPTLQKIDNRSDLHYYAGQWIKARLEESKKTLSAIICRWPKQAEELVAKLKAHGHSYVHLGHRDQFDFSPGIIVTNIHQVKGLEFRNVLIVEPTEEHYGSESEEEQNLLYVAVTRAERRLDFITSERPTKMLPTLPKPEKVVATF